MKKNSLFAVFFYLALTGANLHAQSINNRNWRTYIGDPLNDTLTFHIHSDSSFVTNGKGDVLLHTNCIISGDTLTLADYGTGEYTCPDAKGKYKVTRGDHSFTLALIEDPCDGRAHTLDGLKWDESLK